jgi:hypothetical protein
LPKHKVHRIKPLKSRAAAKVWDTFVRQLLNDIHYEEKSDAFTYRKNGRERTNAHMTQNIRNYSGPNWGVSVV